MQEAVLQLWAATGKTVVFVTHDLDEAVFLSDVVVVLASRPGRVHAVVNESARTAARRSQRAYPTNSPRRSARCGTRCRTRGAQRRRWPADHRESTHGTRARRHHVASDFDRPAPLPAHGRRHAATAAAAVRLPGAHAQPRARRR
jgi:ABC-type sulfate/molybdate transport systems ATPase subunit